MIRGYDASDVSKYTAYQGNTSEWILYFHFSPRKKQPPPPQLRLKWTDQDQRTDHRQAETNPTDHTGNWWHMVLLERIDKPSNGSSRWPTLLGLGDVFSVLSASALVAPVFILSCDQQ